MHACIHIESATTRKDKYVYIFMEYFSVSLLYTIWIHTKYKIQLLNFCFPIQAL